MQRILISLIGGRSAPNVSTILKLQPNIVYFISSNTPPGPDNLNKAITALPEHLTVDSRHQFAVSPNQQSETEQAVKTIAGRHPDAALIVNFASEPKPMTLGAFREVLTLLASGRDVKYCYATNEGVLLWLSHDQQDPLGMSIDGYFAAYGWKAAHKPVPGIERVSALYGRRPVATPALMHRLSAKPKPRLATDMLELTGVSSEELLLLGELAVVEVISGLHVDGDAARFCCDPAYWVPLTSGQWLEHFTYTCAQSLQDKDGQRLFLECQWSFEEAARADRLTDIDFVGLRGNQLTIASCKTRSARNTSATDLDDIHSVAMRLGGEMCSRLFITTALRKDFSGLETFLRHAQERRVVLVFGDDFDMLPDILRKVALNDRDAPPEHVAIYPRM